MRRMLFACAIAAAVLALTLTATPANASTSPPRWRAYSWAITQAGCWYTWAGTGPCSSGYDCSGLVYRAYARLGYYFGRSTYSMLASGRIYPISRPRMGDLAFYGSGHVELYAGRRTSFGALMPGTVAGWHHESSWWHPTMYFRVAGAG